MKSFVDDRSVHWDQNRSSSLSACVCACVGSEAGQELQFAWWSGMCMKEAWPAVVEGREQLINDTLQRVREWTACHESSAREMDYCIGALCTMR